MRALDYYEIDVHVKNRVAYLNGHIVGSSSQNRIKNALQGISGIQEIKNNLVLDDKLTLEVAGSLGKLEHTFNCKFFTGVSHGVVVLNGEVNNIDIRKSAERCAASHPKVRGVINYIQSLELTWYTRPASCATAHRQENVFPKWDFWISETSGDQSGQPPSSGYDRSRPL